MSRHLDRGTCGLGGLLEEARRRAQGGPGEQHGIGPRRQGQQGLLGGLGDLVTEPARALSGGQQVGPHLVVQTPRGDAQRHGGGIKHRHIAFGGVETGDFHETASPCCWWLDAVVAWRATGLRGAA